MNCFEKNSDIEEELFKLLNPRKFVKDIHRRGELKKIHPNYSSNVYGLCRNAIAWAILQLRPTPYLYQVEIVEGSFQGKDHAWFLVGDYYLDLTLAQFIECPEFAVIAVDNGQKIGYQPDRTCSISDWVAEQCGTEQFDMRRIEAKQ